MNKIKKMISSDEAKINSKDKVIKSKDEEKKKERFENSFLYKFSI